MTPQRAKPEKKISCGECNLNRICIPQGMGPEELDYIASTVKRNRSAQKGDYIYHAGDSYTGIFAMKSGTAKLVHTDESGNETIIAILLPGELLGFDGISSGKYICSLVALENSSYCELNTNEIESLSQKVPRLQQILLQRTGDQFNQSIHRISQGQRPADIRLANFLLELTERNEIRGFPGEQIHLSLTRQELGNHLGLALETVSRLLSKFEATQLISVEKRVIRILDKEGLRKLCA